jgi:nicotinate-nucleotide--dimethylbenzimidazole phosphoribosyltransferase
MVGAYLAAASKNIAVIVDGFISGSAALVACTIDPEVERCLFWSHKSAEQGATLLMQTVRETVVMTSNDGSGSSSNYNDNSLKGVIPILDMGLKLGEGTGAVLALPILRSAAAVMTNMAALKDIL